MENAVIQMQSRKPLINYYIVENIICAKELLYNLDILYRNGILVLEGIKNFEMFNDLKKYEFEGNISFSNTGVTFSIFPPRRIKTYNIAINYTEESKKALVEMVDTYEPIEEFCDSLSYVNEKIETILEWPIVGEESQIFISINISEKRVREFCKSMNINYFCTKFYSYS
jgi:hypothetical protein